MQFLDKKTIKIDKEINEVDKFTFRFLDILKKYSDYVIVSGYVAILLGRSRTTEDIDIIIPKLDKEKYVKLFNELIEDGFWCLNSNNTNNSYELLESKSSVRFAIEPRIIPNIELKFSKTIYDKAALKNPIIIRLNDKEIKTSFLELQIAYKEEVLKGNKDLEDAKHIRLIAYEHLDVGLINKYKEELRKT